MTIDVAGKVSTGRVAVRPVKVAKGPETLATLLRDDILSGAIAPGASLAPERTLVEQTGLSRATVREALRILETEGLVVSRPGRNGGARVQPVNDNGVAKAVQFLIRGRRLDEATLRETREVLEGATARLAAERRTAADLAEIAAISARLEAAIDDLPRLAEENARWHIAVAQGGHNPLLTAFMKSIAAAISHPGGGADPALPREGRAALIKAHRRVIEAIQVRDADAAERRMLRHLRAYQPKVAGK
jgi:GntR family transcriptional regulator, transcriptional repressor for pyruvate dehydrogenase complex